MRIQSIVVSYDLNIVEGNFGKLISMTGNHLEKILAVS